jgi:glucan phosphoethanolaminetransferase (alkaline phosphatase superfamily)
MRATRATVPYFFWAATIAAAVLAALVVANLFAVRSQYTHSLWAAIPAILVMFACIFAVVGRASKLLAAPPDEPGFSIDARRARFAQLLFGVLGLAAMVASFFAVERTLSHALTVFFCLGFYLQYLGYFALVRKYA